MVYTDIRVEQQPDVQTIGHVDECTGGQEDKGTDGQANRRTCRYTDKRQS